MNVRFERKLINVGVPRSVGDRERGGVGVASDQSETDGRAVQRRGGHAPPVVAGVDAHGPFPPGKGSRSGEVAFCGVYCQRLHFVAGESDIRRAEFAVLISDGVRVVLVKGDVPLGVRGGENLQSDMAPVAGVRVFHIVRQREYGALPHEQRGGVKRMTDRDRNGSRVSFAGPDVRPDTVRQKDIAADVPFGICVQIYMRMIVSVAVFHFEAVRRACLQPFCAEGGIEGIPAVYDFFIVDPYAYAVVGVCREVHRLFADFELTRPAYGEVIGNGKSVRGFVNPVEVYALVVRDDLRFTGKVFVREKLAPESRLTVGGKCIILARRLGVRDRRDQQGVADKIFVVAVGLAVLRVTHVKAAQQRQSGLVILMGEGIVHRQQAVAQVCIGVCDGLDLFAVKPRHARVGLCAVDPHNW